MKFKNLFKALIHGGGRQALNLGDNDSEKALKARYFLPMWASHEELNLFAKHIINSRSYLEFGCGGSTFLVAYLSLAKIVSIESDKDFIKFISQNEILAQNLASNRLKFTHIDIGATKEWGYPRDDKKRANFPAYSQQIFAQLSKAEISAIDTYFIDGRFRVACILSVLLHANADATIIVHDFWDRLYYHAVLEFVDVIGRVGTLAVFKAKPNLPTKRLKSMLKDYEFVVE